MIQSSRLHHWLPRPQVPKSRGRGSEPLPSEFLSKVDILTAIGQQGYQAHNHSCCETQYVEPTTAEGYERIVRWAEGLGPVRCAGIEGTSSYGAGLARHLKAAGIAVMEVSRGPSDAA